MLPIAYPGALCGSMGLKDAASSLMQAYKCWSLWSLLPAACWSGLEEQLLQRPEDEVLGATGKTLQERARDLVWLSCEDCVDCEVMIEL